MGMTKKDLIDAVNNSDLSTEAKVDFLYKVLIQGRITPGIYIKELDNGYIDAWYINIDEDGTTYHGPTNYTIEQIINEYKMYNGIRLNTK